MIGLGSVVRLRSGGPEMTIVDSYQMSEWSTIRAWKCQWFEGSQVREWCGPVHALEEVKQ